MPLVQQLPDQNLVLIDCRHDLANPAAGRLAYAAGHLPGAHFLHLDEDLSGVKTGHNGRHPLPEPDQLAAKLAAIGVSRHSHVVAYDGQGGMYAARLWWLMRWLGHEQVQVLDGGIGQWQGELTTGLPEVKPGDFTASLVSGMTVTADEVLANLRQPVFTVVDARSPARFMGEGETMDPVGGHIPGAINRFYQLNLQSDGHFKSPEQLRQEWQALPGMPDVALSVQQCGSGVTACHNLLALESAGLNGARLYPGSWSEWCSDALRPVQS